MSNAYSRVRAVLTRECLPCGEGECKEDGHLISVPCSDIYELLGVLDAQRESLRASDPRQDLPVEPVRPPTPSPTAPPRVVPSRPAPSRAPAPDSEQVRMLIRQAVQAHESAKEVLVYMQSALDNGK